MLIDRSLADPAVQSVALTTEEEGVALLAGAAQETQFAAEWGARTFSRGPAGLIMRDLLSEWQTLIRT